MTTAATAIREAIYTRVSEFPGYNKIMREFTPQRQPDDLPSLAIAIINEELTEDGCSEAGDPHFVALITIGISVTRGFDDPAVLAGLIDADIDAIETRLMTDPSFVAPGTSYVVGVGVGSEEQLFSAVTKISRRREYPFDGETYFCELRLEMTFRTRQTFIPETPDALITVHGEAFPIGHEDAPHVEFEFELDQ